VCVRVCNSASVYLPVSFFLTFVSLTHTHIQRVSFTVCCEYTSNSEVSRARSHFFHGEKRFLLITERFYFYKRVRIRNVHNIVFYSLPEHHFFYTDLLNSLNAEGGDTHRLNSSGTTGNNTCVVLFSRYDALELERVVGSKLCKTLLTSQKRTHMFL